MTFTLKPYWLTPSILIGYSVLFGLFKFKSAWLSPPLYFLLCSVAIMLAYPTVFKTLLKKIGRQEVLIGLSITLLPLLAHSFKITSAHYSLMVWFNLLVFAPLGEELYFRGLLQTHLAQRMPIWAGIALQAILFMFCHASWALGPLCLGLMNGFIVSRRKDIRLCILIHVVSNLYGPLALTYFPHVFQKLRFFYY